MDWEVYFVFMELQSGNGPTENIKPGLMGCFFSVERLYLLRTRLLPLPTSAVSPV
jgi:hypothetical protein